MRWSWEGVLGQCTHLVLMGRLLEFSQPQGAADQVTHGLLPRLLICVLIRFLSGGS